MTRTLFDQIPTQPPLIHLSCLVDDHPRFRMQAWNWLVALRALKTRARLFIHHTPTALNPATQTLFQGFGATLVEILPFDQGPARYCNKIRQLETAEFVAADFVMLSDADMIFLQDPADMVRSGCVRARTVDADNPPRAVWTELFDRAGLSAALLRIGETALALDPATTTFATNFNGGFYTMTGDMAQTLLPLWHKHASYCLDQSDLLDKFLLHSDQLGFGMAVAEAGFAVDLLPFASNLPTHLPKDSYARIPAQDIASLHYHKHLDQHGLPLAVGVNWIDRAVVQARKILTDGRRGAFSNEIFWDHRYDQFPELGSGLGSRDAVLAYKHALLRPYVALIGTGSILDVGCGDLEVFGPLPAVNYTGIDISEQALTIARGKRPDWTFANRDIAGMATGSYDYSSCIDVLIHQPTTAAAQGLAENLVRVARKGVFFSIHSAEIQGSGISFNSHGIRDFVANLPGVAAVQQIGSYRDTALYFAEIGLGERRTGHDIGLHELAVGIGFHDDPAALLDLVAFSRARIGFFPRTVIRTHEYPWFARQIGDCAGLKILDVGAGVCCLPFLFADRGAVVTTVDKHVSLRNSQPRDQWNEWGFLDYGAIDQRITSYNTDMSGFDPSVSFDIIYSVSVMEHMPATVRRAAIGRIAQLLGPGGKLYLSLDLIPGTTDLWNMNEGQIVDPAGHGTLADIIAELAGAGLHLLAESTLAGMPLSRTDVAYLICAKAS